MNRSISDAKITVSGCGNMGLPMATALHDAGFNVQGHDVRAINAPFAMVGVEQAADCDVLFSIVRDAAQSHALLYDDAGLLARAVRPELVVICSTLSTRDLASLRDRSPDGVAWVDAPMSGAPVAAQQRRLSFMLGGDPADLNQLAPAFGVMGDPDKVFRLGGFGDGMAVKLLNNSVGAASVVASRLAFERGISAGIDPQALRAVMHVSSGQNWFASNFDAINFAREGYDEANTIGIIHKDVTAAFDGDPHQFGDALLAGLKALEPLTPEGSREE